MNRLILASLSVVLMLAGCSVRPPVQGRLDPYGRNQVYFDSISLKDETAVGEPVPARDDSGYLYVTVPIRSETNKELHVDYRVTWFDKNHQVLSQTGWFTKDLTPKVPDQITVNSMSPRAEQFQVDFRWSK